MKKYTIIINSVILQINMYFYAYCLIINNGNIAYEI